MYEDRFVGVSAFCNRWGYHIGDQNEKVVAVEKIVESIGNKNRGKGGLGIQGLRGGPLPPADACNLNSGQGHCKARAAGCGRKYAGEPFAPSAPCPISALFAGKAPVNVERKREIKTSAPRRLPFRRPAPFFAVFNPGGVRGLKRFGVFGIKETCPLSVAVFHFFR